MKVSAKVDRKTIYFWNMAGSLTYSISSVILLMVVSRLTSARDADTFSIAYSIGQLLSTIGFFQVRNYQATDIQEKYSFQDYLAFRILTNVVMIFSIAVYCAAKGYTGEKLLVVWILCLYKGAESFADLAQGMFQQKERLDLAGRSIVYRMVISMALFLTTLAVTHNLVTGCVVLLVSAVLCMLAFDWNWLRDFTSVRLNGADLPRYKKKICRLFWTCLPLFINGFLIMYIYNAPKTAIDDAITAGLLADGSQRDFNILFMPSSVLNLFMIFLRPLITSMAICWNGGDRQRFYRIIWIMISGMAVFLALILAGGYLLGIPVLGFVFGNDLSGYRKELMLLLLAGGMSSFATVFDNIITVIRKQHWLVASYIASAVIALTGADMLIEKNGLMGASQIFLLCMTVLLAGNLIIVIAGVKKGRA